ncbi:transcription factor bHLH167-like isoform X1 [Punica granatum]|uniref:Transcription factor bHLH167-like isoform X1 n=1 Tax=Punica granatum TaxID=22663 RepID=A0A6P8E067_PUNGR|nr:transcription factor bHLH167-like isoform X1 [Punica granatum]
MIDRHVESLESLIVIQWYICQRAFTNIFKQRSRAFCVVSQQSRAIQFYLYIYIYQGSMWFLQITQDATQTSYIQPISITQNNSSRKNVHFYDMLSQQDQLDFAAAYIKQLRDRIDGLKRRKELAMISNGLNCSGNGGSPNPMANVGVKLPVIELREWESGLEVSLISGVDKNFMLYEVISILHEEGAEVVSASFSTIGDKIFHTLHAQVRISRVGIETSRIWERLQELTC